MNTFKCKTGVDYDLYTKTMYDYQGGKLSPVATSDSNSPLATDVYFSGVATDEYEEINGKQYRKFIKCENLPHNYHTIFLDGNDD